MSADPRPRPHDDRDNNNNNNIYYLQLGNFTYNIYAGTMKVDYLRVHVPQLIIGMLNKLVNERKKERMNK